MLLRRHPNLSRNNKFVGRGCSGVDTTSSARGGLSLNHAQKILHGLKRLWGSRIFLMSVGEARRAACLVAKVDTVYKEFDPNHRMPIDPARGPEAENILGLMGKWVKERGWGPGHCDAGHRH